MEKKRRYLNPDELTPAERLDRVIELLAKASFLLAVEEMKGGESGNKEGEPVDPIISAPSFSQLPIKSGPVPYGQRQFGLDRAGNESEMKWVKRIEGLARIGLSTGKIAKRLNEEDKKSRRAGKLCRSTVWRILKRIENSAE